MIDFISKPLLALSAPRLTRRLFEFFPLYDVYLDFFSVRRINLDSVTAPRSSFDFLKQLGRDSGFRFLLQL